MPGTICEPPTEGMSTLWSMPKSNGAWETIGGLQQNYDGDNRAKRSQNQNSQADQSDGTHYVTQMRSCASQRLRRRNNSEKIDQVFYIYLQVRNAIFHSLDISNTNTDLKRQCRRVSDCVAKGPRIEPMTLHPLFGQSRNLCELWTGRKKHRSLWFKTCLPKCNTEINSTSLRYS